MPPLIANATRQHSSHSPQWVPLPVQAGVNIYDHAIVCTTAAGLAVPGADVAGLTCWGVAWRGFDNSTGPNGVVGSGIVGSSSGSCERYVEVDGQGEWEFAVTGATPIPGDTAYVVDDNTVSADPTANQIVLGRFTRPGITSGYWFVDVERR